MHAFLKSQIFRSGKSHFRGDQSLHYRVICQVQVHNYVIRYAAFFKGTTEKFCYVIFDTHSCKNNSEFLVRIFSQRRLLYDLGSQLVVRKTISRENRKFLSSDQCGKSVNGGDTGSDIVSRIFAGYRI